MKNTRRFESDEFYYEFEIIGYNMPNNRVVYTIMFSSSNIISVVDAERILPDVIQFLANLCVEYKTICDSYHCRIEPYDSDRIEEIVESINAVVATKRTNP